MNKLQLYMRADDERPPELRWCGVIVQLSEDENSGEVLDAMLKPSEEELLEWFQAWQDGIAEKGKVRAW